MRGGSSNRTPGIRRRGPIEVSGLGRSDKTGSARIFESLCRMSTVAWLIAFVPDNCQYRQQRT
jgi:hypothetical protein